MNINKINSKVNELTNLIDGNIEYNNWNFENLKKISTIAKEVLKDVTNNNIKNGSRCYVAAEELAYFEELIEQYEDDKEEMDLSKYVHMFSLFIDASNNIAHDTSNYNLRKSIFTLKSLGIANLENNINLNKEKIDIISGVQYDDAKENINKSVYVIDIPHIGQVSWHMDTFTHNKLEENGISQYPYKLEKDDNHVSGILLNSVYTDYKFMPHNALVQNVDEGKESQIRKALDIYYKYSRNCATEKGRDIITKVLSNELDMSEQLLETLSKILRTDYSKIKNNIQEQKKNEQEKQSKEEQKSGP